MTKFSFTHPFDINERTHFIVDELHRECRAFFRVRAHDVLQ